jgi:hypothetical protein
MTSDNGITREDVYSFPLNFSLFSFSLDPVHQISLFPRMFATYLRTVCRNGPRAARNFSSTAATSAAEVKSLGVIGAGQMVNRENLTGN